MLRRSAALTLLALSAFAALASIGASATRPAAPDIVSLEAYPFSAVGEVARPRGGARRPRGRVGRPLRDLVAHDRHPRREHVTNDPRRSRAGDGIPLPRRRALAERHDSPRRAGRSGPTPGPARRRRRQLLPRPMPPPRRGADPPSCSHRRCRQASRRHSRPHRPRRAPSRRGRHSWRAPRRSA